MNHRLLLSVAAATLIAGGTAVHAQSPSGSTGAGGGAPAPSVGQSPSSGSGAGAGASQTQRSDSDRSGASREAPTIDRSAGNDRDRDRDMQRGADSRRDGDRDVQRGADKDRSRDTQRGADNDRDREGSATTTGQAGTRAKLSGEQRSKITTVIKNQRVEPQTNINFSISVGTRVPRDVRFHPLPAEIITIYPDWRGYEFFRVRDEIVVVDPRTLEIVAVLDI
jgi:hypothetical protein